MSNELRWSARANESIAAYTVVAANGSTTTQYIRVETADTSTSLPLGVAQDVASTDGAVNVAIGGVARGLLATTTALGNILTWQTATGQLMPVDATASITVRCIAVALAPGTNGSVIPILVTPQLIPNI